MTDKPLKIANLKQIEGQTIETLIGFYMVWYLRKADYECRKFIKYQGADEVGNISNLQMDSPDILMNNEEGCQGSVDF